MKHHFLTLAGLLTLALLVLAAWLGPHLFREWHP